MNVRTLLEGCGIGIALTLSYIWQPLAPAHIQGLYLRVLPVSSVAGGAALDLIAASLLSCGVLLLLDRFDKPGATLAWALFATVIPAVVIHSALRLAEVNFPVPSTATMAVALLLPTFVLWWIWRAGYRKLIAAFRLGYVCLGICIVWVLPELGYGAVHQEPRDLMQTQRVVDPPAANASQKRIIWLLLDELSYDQTFDHRQAGLKLDNFDRLKATSTSFANVQPVGYLTDEIVPALLTGQPVVDIESSADGDLLMKRSQGGDWERLTPHATVFGDAEQLGWSTGIAGWFNPYCRIFGSMVNRCVWEPESRMFPGHMSAANAAWQNAMAPLGAKFHVDADSRLAAEHGKAYTLLTASALEMVRGGGERFVFAHLPAPHPPGIYDRTSGRMRVGGSYLDNLVLADKTVGEMMAAIAGSPEAQSTILIVSSDHSMRVPKWRGGASWTPEDEHVFGTRFDTRPVLMVHFAGQQAGKNASAPFAEIRTHDMLEAMLAGRLAAESDLDAWVQQGNIQ
jgi:Sulfatase